MSYISTWLLLLVFVNILLTLGARPHWGQGLPASLPLVPIQRERSFSQFRGDMWSAHRPNRYWLPRPWLSFQISSHPNSSWCWIGTDPTHWPKIPPTAGIDLAPHSVTKVQRTIFYTKWLSGRDSNFITAKLIWIFGENSLNHFLLLYKCMFLKS